jgi:dsDNA-binding SOS-regulon protein
MDERNTRSLAALSTLTYVVNQFVNSLDGKSKQLFTDKRIADAFVKMMVENDKCYQEIRDLLSQNIPVEEMSLEDKVTWLVAQMKSLTARSRW